MSVNSKMTAIADKVRALLGVTGTMGLDAMTNNLGTAVNECDSQAALIAQIEAALDGKATSGGSGGVTGKRATGTFTTDSTGNFAVSLDFVPDFVSIHVAVVDDLEQNLTFSFAENFTLKNKITACRDSVYAFIQGGVTVNSGGFAGYLGAYDWDMEFYNVSGRTLSYIAVKHT